MAQSQFYASSGRRIYDPELHTNHGKPWMFNDEKYLIEHYDTMGMEHCSFALGRTESTLA